MNKFITSVLAASIALASSSAFANAVSAQEKECLAKTVAIETLHRKVTNNEIRAITEMYINQSRTNGYPDTFCGILNVRSQKPWNKEFAERIHYSWPFGNSRHIKIANELVVFYDMKSFQPITGGAIEYNTTGVPPKSNMFPTVKSGRYTFYSTYKW